MAADLKTLVDFLAFSINRTSGQQPDSDYLELLLNSAEEDVKRSGIRPTEETTYTLVIVETASWMYRKRLTGEPMPAFLRRMRNNLLVSQKMQEESETDAT